MEESKQAYELPVNRSAEYPRKIPYENCSDMVKLVSIEYLHCLHRLKSSRSGRREKEGFTMYDAGLVDQLEQQNSYFVLGVAHCD